MITDDGLIACGGWPTLQIFKGTEKPKEVNNAIH
jgi:hypothetical protein